MSFTVREGTFDAGIFSKYFMTMNTNWMIFVA